MSLNELFAVNTSIRLTPDINSWADQITSALLNKFPTLSKLVGDVTFTKVEDAKGNAVGYVSLVGKAQRIPFIVDEFELNPLDLFIDNGMYLPLTELSIQRLEKREWPFRLVSQNERNTIIKTASLIENSGRLKDEFISKHEEELNKIANECPEIIEEFANCEKPSEDKEQTIVRYFIKEASSDKPIVARDMVGPDKEYKISEAVKLFDKDFVRKLMTDKEIVIDNLTPIMQLALDKAEVKNAYKPTAGRVGYYEDGVNYIKSKVFDYYNLSTLKIANLSSIIITKDGRFLTTGGNTKLVNRVGKTDDDNFAIHADEPAVGDLVGFVLGNNFYGPAILKSVGVTGKDKIYTVTTKDLKTIRLRTTDEIKSIVALDDTNYLISYDLTMVKLTSFTPSNLDTTEIIKQASDKITVSKQLNNKIKIQDHGFSKVASERLVNMNSQDADLVLRRCGLSKIDSDYVMMKVAQIGTYSFPVPQISSNNESVEVELEKKAAEITSLCDESNLLKTAVITGDKSNIDLALGLNLITYNNIKRFKLLVPEIYQMLDRLCKLLVVKRMNRSMFDVQESQLTQAIFALEEIANSLGSL